MYAAHHGAAWECVIYKLHCPKVCVTASPAALQLEKTIKERLLFIAQDNVNKKRKEKIVNRIRIIDS